MLARFWHPFETIGMLCMMDQVSLPKHGRCEYNEREPCCSYASSNAPISPRRGSIRALCLHLHQATSMFQLSRDPRTFVALDKAIDNLTFAQNVCRGSVNFLVFALMGFPYESAPLRPLIINGRHQDHWWASGFAALPHHLRGHPSQVRAGPDRREERTHDRPCGMR